VKGVYVPEDRVEEYKAVWANSGLTPTEVVRTFDNAVALFPSDNELVLGQMFATGVDDGETKLFADEEAKLIRELAEPKPKTLTEDDYERRYQGYDWLLTQGVIEDRCSKAAHKAWTTTRLWQSEMLRGNFTHLVRVTYSVGGQAFAHHDKAVSLKHAKAVARKAVRKLAKDLGVSKLVHEVEISPISEAQPIGEAV
jgi:hypothetical protein